MSETDIHPPVTVVQWIEESPGRGLVRLLDQTLLPNEASFMDCGDTESMWDAIRRLVVRGAPAIGVAAGYGTVLAAQEAIAAAAGEPAGGGAFARKLAELTAYLKSSRPTAVNLAWAVDRVMARCAAALAGGADPRAARDAMLAEAREIHAEDERMCLAIGRHAAPLLEGCQGVLTHCNAGALATAGIGTATAGIYVAHAAGRRFTVYCDETRPLLQGARLTAWELMRAGVDAVLITDSMAAVVLREKRAQAVLVGADRIAANGDTANKIGTYGLAIVAARHGVPFYVAAPYSTFDLSLPSGGAIPIEQRPAEEITEGFGRRTAPRQVKTYSPAFDVTPAELISGIVTDRGVIRPVNEQNVRRVLGT